MCFVGVGDLMSGERQCSHAHVMIVNVHARIELLLVFPLPFRHL